MIKALLKKQLSEIFSFIYKNKKTGKLHTGRSLVIKIILFSFVLLVLCGTFFALAELLCQPLYEAGFGWLYFAIMGLIAVVLGVFGSIFSTYSSLYRAKDNDLLLSMPIPPSVILPSRLFGVYILGLMYELCVMLPAVLASLIHMNVTAAGVVGVILITVLLSVFILTLSAVLGWVVAAISGKLRHKNIITVILSLVFIGAYYYFYNMAFANMNAFLANPGAVGDSVKSYLYPFYHMGLAAGGNIVSMLIFAGIILALFAAVYVIMSLSFIKLATSSSAAPKVKYKEKAVKAGSAGSALLKKELRTFLGSPTYMLNCGLGIVLMLIGAVAMLIKSGDIYSMYDSFINMGFAIDKDLGTLMIAAALCMIASMNDISAPSVSLEGKRLWLVQSLPVTAWQVLSAKLKLHMILALVPGAVLTVCAGAVLRLPILHTALLLAVFVLFTALSAETGLLLNLKMPILDWSSEVVPVKQSMSVVFTMFGGWVAVIALGALYYFISAYISAFAYLLLALLLMAAADALLLLALKTKGAKMFEAL